MDERDKVCLKFCRCYLFLFSISWGFCFRSRQWCGSKSNTDGRLAATAGCQVRQGTAAAEDLFRLLSSRVSPMLGWVGIYQICMLCHTRPKKRGYGKCKGAAGGIGCNSDRTEPSKAESRLTAKERSVASSLLRAGRGPVGGGCHFFFSIIDSRRNGDLGDPW